MKFNQDLLIIALKILETTELSKTDDIKLFLSSLNYLYLMTECQNWKALQKNMSMIDLEIVLCF